MTARTGMNVTETALQGVHTHRLDADTETDADANADEEGEAREAREGGDLGKDKELIGRGGNDKVDASGRHCMGGAKGKLGEADIERPPRRTSP